MLTREEPFAVDITVRGYELDAFNHVNHAVFLQYFEHARWMAFKDVLGFEALARHGVSFVVRKVTVEYDRPAVLFDELSVRLWIERIGNTSVTFGQDILRRQDGQVLARAEVVAVCLGADGRPHPVPEEWREGAEAAQS